MLLILESTPILGNDVYASVIRDAVAAYWTNQEYHTSDYLPFCLLNDVVRYWRNLLLNYEHKTARKLRELERETKDKSPEEVALRKQRLQADKWLRSCKLRFTRCLTCYATVAWLLGRARETGNITQADFVQAVSLTPTKRLEAAAATGGVASQQLLDTLLQSYEQFLTVIDRPKRGTPAAVWRWGFPTYADGFG